MYSAELLDYVSTKKSPFSFLQPLNKEPNRLRYSPQLHTQPYDHECVPNRQVASPGIYNFEGFTRIQYSPSSKG